MKFRKIIFWLHLICGLITGIIIAIMCVTGLALAFEHDITTWADRKVSMAHAPNIDAKPLSFAEQYQLIQQAEPEFSPRLALIPVAKDQATHFIAGHHSLRYLDPYTQEIHAPTTPRLRAFLHFMEELHIHLALKGDSQALGHKINALSNLALVGLCLSGLYLWFPRRWSRKVLQSILWIRINAKGKARDFNWHNALGFWAMLPLLILSATAVTFSYAWAHNLVFLPYGEEAPAARDGRMLASPKIELTVPENATPLPIDTILSKARDAFPAAESFGLSLSSIPKGTPEAGSPIKPIQLVAFEPAIYSTRGRIQLQIDPWNGAIVDKLGFEDRSKGLQARIWIRFLHTGEAYGMLGKIIAAIACAVGVVLVYTGFALTWRRFAKYRRTTS
jgi:uncharacterized iron-regulated membrane protein